MDIIAFRCGRPAPCEFSSCRRPFVQGCATLAAGKNLYLQPFVSSQDLNLDTGDIRPLQFVSWEYERDPALGIFHVTLKRTFTLDPKPAITGSWAETN